MVVVVAAVSTVIHSALRGTPIYPVLKHLHSSHKTASDMLPGTSCSQFPGGGARPAHAEAAHRMQRTASNADFLYVCSILGRIANLGKEEEYLYVYVYATCARQPKTNPLHTGA